MRTDGEPPMMASGCSQHDDPHPQENQEAPLRRAASVCSEPRCPELKPCPKHKKTYHRRHNERSNQRYGSAEYKRNRKKAFERDGHRCCFIENGKRCEARDKLTAHHKMPVGEGGSHDLNNLVTLCNPHNQRVDAERRKRKRSR